MSSHVLLSTATRRPFKEAPEMPPNAEYDKAAGHWNVAGKPLVTSEGGYGPGATKKCDQETGEDQKGE